MGVINQENVQRCCIVTQQQLENIVGDLAPDAIDPTTGLLNALRDPRNTNGFEAVQTGNHPGKAAPGTAFGEDARAPILQIKYIKPDCSPSDEGQLALCDEGDPVDPYGYKQVELDLSRNKKFRISQEQFDQVCEGRNEVIAIKMRHLARQLRQDIERDLIGLALAATGMYAGGGNSQTSPQTLNLFSTNQFGAYANPNAFIPLTDEYFNMHSMDSPLIVAGSALKRYFDSRRVGGLGANSLNASAPNDLGGLSAFFNTQFDAVVNGIAGGSQFNAISWLPGAMQLLTWNKFKGDWTMSGDDFVMTTMNVDGIEWDYVMNFIKCDPESGLPVWDIGLGLTYDLFHLTDELNDCYDFNYILRWLLDCGEDECENLIGTPQGSESVVL